MTSLVRLLRFVNIFSSGIAAGGFIMVLASLVPAKRKFNENIAVELHQVTTVNIDRYMPQASMAATLTGVLALLLSLRRGLTARSNLFTLAGLGASAGVAGASLGINMPINRRIATWSPSAVPAEYGELRDRWDRVHVLRTTCGVLAFVFFLMAGLAEDDD